MTQNNNNLKYQISKLQESAAFNNWMDFKFIINNTVVYTFHQLI